jgi:hypothetical protein
VTHRLPHLWTRQRRSRRSWSSLMWSNAEMHICTQNGRASGRQLGESPSMHAHIPCVPADLHLLFDVDPGLCVAEMLIGGPIVPCLQVAYKGQRSGSAQVSFPNETARVRIRSRSAGSSPGQTVRERREVAGKGGCYRRSEHDGKNRRPSFEHLR